MSDVGAFTLLVMIFLSFILWQGEPDLHDAIVKWVHNHIEKETACSNDLTRNK